MPHKIVDRIHTAESIANGTHPLFKAEFYSGKKKSKDKIPAQLPIRSPLTPFPAEFSERQALGDQMTELLFQEREANGGPIVIYDGFTFRAITEAGPFIVLCDSQADPFIGGIIEKTEKRMEKKDVNITPAQLAFYIGLQCFGDWGHKRYPLESLKTSWDNPTQVYLGELVWTTQFTDLDCSLLSMAMQVAGQPLLPGLTFHLGQAARFSPYCHGKGPHVWNMLKINEEENVVIDWSNFPPSLNEIFRECRQTSFEDLHAKFIHTFFRFPTLYTEKKPPTLDQYDDLYASLGCDDSYTTMLFAARNNAVYWSDEGQYLGSCRLPGGWDI